MMPQLDIFHIPKQDLTIYSSSYDDRRVFRVELKSQDLERRAQDQQRIDCVEIFVVPEQNERFWRLHRENNPIIIW